VAGRHQAMLARCRELLEVCERQEPGGELARRWQARLAITACWTE
jgi:hypothetical protein